MTRRPIKFKLDAFRFYVEGDHPQQCFEKASSANGGVKLSKCMTDRQYASSYMSDDIRGFLRRKLAAGDPEVHQYFEQHNLAKDA